LKEKLPDYMVPSAFVFLEIFPVSPAGKIDRRALPAPDQSSQEIQEAFVAPRSMAEEVVADIWAEVLGLERVGVHDDFFVLGGHSLLATQIVSRLRDDLQVAIRLRDFFESPTIAQLALTVEDALLEELETLTDKEAQRLIEAR
jgi:acyl carrier protein